MKPYRLLLAATLLLGAPLSVTRAATEVSIDFFHDNLEAYGDWREVGDYGYCWQPRDVDRNWRPYADGRWLYTDAGWTWDSDEPFAWATYHYGRWAQVENVGWVWAPGTEWGPAWVSWRSSPEHIGWAPLPPEARFNRDTGFSTRVDADYDIGPTSYNFVDVRSFGAPHLNTVLLEPRENITIIRETTNITRISYANDGIHNGGPRYEEISRESAQPIRRLKLERRSQFEGDPRSVRADQLRASVAGDSFRVLALPIDNRPATAPRKVAAPVERTAVDHGWKNAGPAAEMQTLRTKIKSEPASSAAASPAPGTGKTPRASAESPIPNAVPETAPPKEKAHVAGRAEHPDAKAKPEGLPPAPVKPTDAKESEPAAPKFAKPSKHLPAPTPVEPNPSAETNQPGVKKHEVPSGIADPQTNEKPHGRKPKTEEPIPKTPPTPASEPTPHEKGDAKPKKEDPSPRNAERRPPAPPVPRPEARKAEPAQPAGHEPAEGKTKGKHPDDKKDSGKPESPQ